MEKSKEIQLDRSEPSMKLDNSQGEFKPIASLDLTEKITLAKQQDPFSLNRTKAIGNLHERQEHENPLDRTERDNVSKEEKSQPEREDHEEHLHPQDRYNRKLRESYEDPPDDELPDEEPFVEINHPQVVNEVGPITKIFIRRLKTSTVRKRNKGLTLKSTSSMRSKWTSPKKRSWFTKRTSSRTSTKLTSQTVSSRSSFSLAEDAKHTSDDENVNVIEVTISEEASQDDNAEQSEDNEPEQEGDPLEEADEYDLEEAQIPDYAFKDKRKKKQVEDDIEKDLRRFDQSQLSGSNDGSDKLLKNTTKTRNPKQMSGLNPKAKAGKRRFQPEDDDLNQIIPPEEESGDFQRRAEPKIQPLKEPPKVGHTEKPEKAEIKEASKDKKETKKPKKKK